MPLKPGKSNKIREENIEEMIDSGMPPKRAVAAGYSNQRKSDGKVIAKKAINKKKGK